MSEKAAIKIKKNGQWVAVPVILSEGISPVVEVEEIEGGHRITIIDKDGSKTFDVMDGAGGGSDLPLEKGEGTNSLKVVGCTARNDCSVAIGDGTTATGADAFAFGMYSRATGHHSVAGGAGSQATGFASVAIGTTCEAKNDSACAFGEYVIAEGYAAFAEGNHTLASGGQSHAEGLRTEAHGSEQHVQGKLNVPDYDGRYAHIVGNGTPHWETDDFVEIRSNAHTLDWQGNGWFAGDVYVGGVSQDDGAQKLMTKAEMQAELQAYVNESILGGAW